MDSLNETITSALYEAGYIRQRYRQIAEIDAAPALPPPLQQQQQERSWRASGQPLAAG